MSHFDAPPIFVAGPRKKMNNNKLFVIILGVIAVVVLLSIVTHTDGPKSNGGNSLGLNNSTSLTPRESLELEVSAAGIGFGPGGSVYGTAADVCDMLQGGLSVRSAADSLFSNSDRGHAAGGGISLGQAYKFVGIAANHLCPQFLAHN